MDELNQLCDEIIQMIPSPNLKDTTSSQFKTFLTKLEKDKLDPQQIKALKQAYDYFNYLMGNVGDRYFSKSNDTKGPTDTTDTNETNETKVTKSTEEKKNVEEKKENPDSEMIEMLLNLAEASESKNEASA